MYISKGENRSGEKILVAEGHLLLLAIFENCAYYENCNDDQSDLKRP